MAPDPYALDALPQRQQMTAYEFLAEKPLPSLPSPTLTNPDMVLPDVIDMPGLPSSPRSMKRPPSPSYLRDRANEQVNGKSPAPKKEKRGLMSRKMMLLRSRSSSGNTVNGSKQQQLHTPRSVPSLSDAASVRSDYNSTYASSPTLMDVGNLAPERLAPERPSEESTKGLSANRLSTSGSSFNSEELAGIPSFLARYEATDGTTTDDELYDGESPAPKRYGYSVSIEGGRDAQRRQQEEDEHNSAILSKRAEQILANAKKRLNLMEGNLRGARDLVAPLTAANLKRAASLGSSHHSSSYAARGRFLPDGYRYEPPSQLNRVLHAQASSPTMGRDYTGHARGFSETELPERPHTALGRDSTLTRSGRIPVRTSEGSWTPSLRNSRSFDSFGSNAPRERPLHAKGSPDSNLEPLAEDDGSQQAPPSRNSRIIDDRELGLGIQRPTSRTEDLREQMSSLKGKISSLKERAREDSLRRRSMQSLRTPSPFNNAVATPPEYFYAQSPGYGSPVLDTNSGVGRTSHNNSPATPQSVQKAWEQTRVSTGSRNAFAEQAAVQRHPQQPAAATRTLSSDTKAPSYHRRTPSGTAIVAPATDRYSHHHATGSRDMPGTFVGSEAGDPSSGEESDGGISPLPSGERLTPDYDHVVSEEEMSVYEDAELDQPPVVAHEDRDDAFDYEHFFLHSAMATYGNGRRNSTSSEESVSSTATARGPTAAADEEFNPDSALFPPPTPETPERLREIERNLHKRTLSGDSVSTLATFATANEGQESPTERSRQETALDWPIPPDNNSNNTSRPNSRPTSRRNSRPSTAIKRLETHHRDSSSERADSGVGFPRRSHSSHEPGRRPGMLTPKSPPYTNFASPPMSPRSVAGALQDPATVAVNALLHPEGRQLGLKDKAILFGLVENLRRVCHQMQEEDEGQYESRVLRRRLDAAKRALDGTLEQRPGSS